MKAETMKQKHTFTEPDRDTEGRTLRYINTRLADKGSVQYTEKQSLFVCLLLGFCTDLIFV